MCRIRENDWVRIARSGWIGGAGVRDTRESKRWRVCDPGAEYENIPHSVGANGQKIAFYHNLKHNIFQFILKSMTA